MTGSGYHMAMKSVGIADLKAHLSEHLRRIRRGHSLTVMDGATPIARILPYQAAADVLVVRRPAPDAPPIQAVMRPPPLRLRHDIVRLLLEERGRGR
jgi:antitoxin (DNA-binding transcriptional repressor) of toxin-antitoxin stability system